MAVPDKNITGRKPRPKISRPPLNRYYRSQAEPSASPFVKKSPKRPVRKFLLGFVDIIILVALLLAFFYALSLKPDPLIDSNDFSYHPKADYAAAARAQFGRFMNRNKITFNESAITRELQQKFPEISSIQVELPFFSEQPVLHMTIAKPSLVLNSQDSAWVVDSSGVAVGPAAQYSTKNLPIIQDKSGYSAKAGTQVMNSGMVDFIRGLIAQCRRSQVPVASLTLPAAAQELQLRTKDTDYFVKFYLDGDVLQETGQFLAARAHFTQTHQPPAAYLDVRVPGKIFYK